jgi:polyhydroxyalkanoate synthesis regulator phasin
MAEQRSSGTGGRRTGASSKRAAATGGVNELRDALSSLIDPLGMVMLTRERIEDALNDAVSRGRVTADDAQDLVTSLVERGRRQTNDVLGELEDMVAHKADRARAKADKARRAAGMGSTAASFPIAGYEDLTAAQVQARLDGLAPADLRKVREHEKRHANRKTVLRVIDQRLK